MHTFVWKSKLDVTLTDIKLTILKSRQAWLCKISEKCYMSSTKYVLLEHREKGEYSCWDEIVTYANIR